MKKAIKIIIILLVIAGLATGGYFGVKASRSKAKPVSAFSVSNFADYGWNNSSSSGFIMAGSNENYKKDGNAVSKVYVKVGDEVSPGDPLFAYDADTANESFNQASNALKLARLQYKKTDETLQKYWTIQPKEKLEAESVVTVDYINSFEQAANYGTTDKITQKAYDGSEERPYEFNCTTYTMVEPLFLLTQILDAPDEIILSDYSESHGISDKDYFKTLHEEVDKYDKELEAYEKAKAEYDKEKAAYDKLTDAEKASTKAPVEPTAPTGPDPRTKPVGGSNGKHVLLTIYNQLDQYKEMNLRVCMEPITILEIKPKDLTKGDLLELEQLLYSGWSVANFLPETTKAGIFAPDAVITDPSGIATELAGSRRTEPLPSEIPVPEVLFQTEEERLMAIIGLQQQLESQKLAILQAEVNYKRAAATATDGIVRTKCKGVVKVVNDYAYLNFGESFIRVQGDSGYLVRGTVSEMNRDKAAVGSTVMINSYMTGMSFPATVTKLYDTPTKNNMGYSEDPNTSFYQFEAAIDPDMEVNPDDWVEIQFEAEASSNFYIPLAFVRKDGGQYYVMKHEDGKLVKQPILTGKTMYGYEVEILKGLTMEDAIAFPYGKNVVEGARCEISENLSELYE